ncbi:MAG TPA: hypothetical protein PLX59_05135 [Candidatus Cloacimonadota bacterium]|nr:hypothetical protein [Candidatus Cloacimonadota bacterium]
MKKFLLLAVVLLAVSLQGMQQRQEIEGLAVQLAGLIEIGQPLFLELRAGEWTSSLEAALRSELLLRGADLRENTDAHSSVFFLEEQEGLQASLVSRLESYGLDSASLVQVNMEIGWETVEHKGFLSYRRERHPVYNFTVKQISLPEARLTMIRSLVFQRSSDRTGELLGSRLRWFEPVVASLGLASIVYLLWTTQ